VIVLWCVDMAGRTFFRPLDTGRAVCYFRPASGIDRSASWCRFPRRGARSARSILTGEALTGRRVPERPARPCGLEPADAGGPGTWGRRPRTAAQRPPAGRPLEDAEKLSYEHQRTGLAGERRADCLPILPR
jgi:hypothetical protein